MNSITRQYIFGFMFVALGIYQAWKNDYIESSLYSVAGLAFVVNALTLEPRFAQYKKPLVIITWALIISSAILFLYILQFKF